MFPQKNIKDFFDVVLKGESKTYNDHNWYNSNGLSGYIQGSYGSPYELLKKNLSEYTIGEIIDFQSRERDSIGQLWATGRYQIIPDTLRGAYRKAGLNESDKYNGVNQDKIALQLIYERSDLKNYITQKVPDNKQNLEKAALSVAKIWSSVGVPYRMRGSRRWVNKNESYYSGGGDKASVSTESVQIELKKLRASFGKKDSIIDKFTPPNPTLNNAVNTRPKKYTGIILFSLVLLLIGLYIFYIVVYDKKIPNILK